MKAIIFDLDGTLYDNSKLPFQLIMRSLGKLRILKSERTSRKILAGVHFNSPEEFYKKHFDTMSHICGRSPEKVEKWYHECYMPLMIRVLSKRHSCKSNVAETLNELRKNGIKTAVLSDYECVKERLAAVNLDPDMFDICIDAPTTGGLKPDKSSFLHIAKAFGFEPDEILVVGDRPDTDGKGAANAGMQMLLVNKKDSRLNLGKHIEQNI